MFSTLSLTFAATSVILVAVSPVLSSVAIFKVGIICFMFSFISMLVSVGRDE